MKGGGGQAIHQNVHRGLFWVVSLQLIFSQNKCFKKVQSHLEPPVLAPCHGGVCWGGGASVPWTITCNSFRPGPQIPKSSPRGLE